MTTYPPLPLNELQIGRWYVGRGGNGNVGLWNGDCFLVIGLCGTPVNWQPRKWINHPCIKQEPYFTCFLPFSLIEEDGQFAPDWVRLRNQSQIE